MQKNKKICVVCGKEFYAPPSSKKITCSKACQRIRARNRQTGAKRSAETKEKIAAAGRKRDVTELCRAGTEAALKSPRSGPFETNVNAIDWHLISPDGKHYHFRSLNNWLRENGKELFGVEPDSREFHNTRSGLCGAKRAAQGKKYGSLTYKGWQVIPIPKSKQ